MTMRARVDLGSGGDRRLEAVGGGDDDDGGVG